MRREDLSGELQGEPGEAQPTETIDDAEARADFWSTHLEFNSTEILRRDQSY